MLQFNNYINIKIKKHLKNEIKIPALSTEKLSSIKLFNTLIKYYNTSIKYSTLSTVTRRILREEYES